MNSLILFSKIDVIELYKICRAAFALPLLVFKTQALCPIIILVVQGLNMFKSRTTRCTSGYCLRMGDFVQVYTLSPSIKIMIVEQKKVALNKQMP